MSSHVDDGVVTAGAVTDAAAEHVDVLVIGEALVDIVHRDGEVLEHPGGSPANVALGLGRLGVDVALFTDLGRDERGARVAAHLSSSTVRVLPGSFSLRQTSTASAFIGPDGSASYEFDVHWNPWASRLPVRPRIVHTGSIAAFLAPGAGAVRNLLRELDADELTFDPNIRPALIGTHSEAMPAFEAMASLATVVKLSDEDAAWLYPGRSPRAVLETIRSLGPGLVAMTIGAHGSLMSVGQDIVEIPAVTVDVVDTIGAGDSFMASLIASLLEHPGRSLSAERARDIGRRASAAAALTVSRAGALPCAAELQRSLRAQVVDACLLVSEDTGMIEDVIENPSNRPLLEHSLSSREFQRWYWLKDELESFARSLGVRATGSKDAIADRISAALDGKPAPHEASTRRASGSQLTGSLSEATIIPPGQRCSQTLRAWFTERVGDQFRFDAPMREFIAAADGTSTLGDALHVWHTTRDRTPDEIGGQFELNRFTRHWHEQNPGGSREQLLRAWAAYRNTPIEARGKI